MSRIHYLIQEGKQHCTDAFNFSQKLLDSRIKKKHQAF